MPSGHLLPKTDIRDEIGCHVSSDVGVSGTEEASEVSGKVDARLLEVYERHYRDIYAYCRRRVSADGVDDAVSETFLIAWRKRAMMPEGEDTLPWLYGVAYRVVLHKWRGGGRIRRMETKLASLGVAEPSTAEELLVVSEESRQVIEASSRLRPKDQELLRLSFWEELSHAEVARVLGIKPEAVRQRVSRALKALAREYDRLDRRRVGPTPLRKEVGDGH